MDIFIVCLRDFVDEDVSTYNESVDYYRDLINIEQELMKQVGVSIFGKLRFCYRSY